MMMPGCSKGNTINGGGPPLPLPLSNLTCIVCYNEFASYTLSCSPWEEAVTKDFYVALNIPQSGSGGDDDEVNEDVTALPFCPECHSKVAVMCSLHQQLLNILQNFNCVRNDLAFTVVKSFDKDKNKEGKKGPLDMIRDKIRQRWIQLYEQAKESEKGSQVVDRDLTYEYLKPGLSVKDEFPVDSTTMSLSNKAKQRLGEMRKTPAMMMGKKHEIEEGGMPILEPMRNTPVKHGVAEVKKTPEKSGIKKKLVLNKGESIMKEGNLSNFIVSTNLKEVKTKGPKRLASGMYKCGSCPVTYDTAAKVRQHASRFHPETMPLRCTMCPKGFSHRNAMSKHLMASHAKEMKQDFAKCPYCPRLFSQKGRFNQHIVSFHEGKRIPDFQASVSRYRKDVKREENDVQEANAGNEEKSANKVQAPAGSPPSPEITDLQHKSDLKKTPQPTTSLKGGTKRSKESSDKPAIKKRRVSSVIPQSETGTVNSVPSADSLKCTTCDKVFKGKGSLVRHSKWHTTNEKMTEEEEEEEGNEESATANGNEEPKATHVDA